MTPGQWWNHGQVGAGRDVAQTKFCPWQRGLAFGCWQQTKNQKLKVAQCQQRRLRLAGLDRKRFLLQVLRNSLAFFCLAMPPKSLFSFRLSLLKGSCHVKSCLSCRNDTFLGAHKSFEQNETLHVVQNRSEIKITISFEARPNPAKHSHVNKARRTKWWVSSQRWNFLTNALPFWTRWTSGGPSRAGQATAHAQFQQASWALYSGSSLHRRPGSQNFKIRLGYPGLVPW